MAIDDSVLTATAKLKDEAASGQVDRSQASTVQQPMNPLETQLYHDPVPLAQAPGAVLSRLRCILRWSFRRDSKRRSSAVESQDSYGGINLVHKTRRGPSEK